ncbi:DUF3108 domain-containing protein [bacterium]|nr:DUF3108 domain-containing protein [bacterium]MBU1957876.1 DUF3108 domain-containing protein [bacterium]
MKKLLMVFGSLLCLSSMVQAETIRAEYKVEFGIIGEIGIAQATLVRDNKNYQIDVELKATGIAKTLSGNQQEHHVSRGHIENGIMVSDIYQIIKSHGSKTSNKVYRIDHKTKTVYKEHKRWKNQKITMDENSTIDFYSKDDLLTLYFNLDKKIMDKVKSNNYTFEAVGAEKQSGSVDVVIPKNTELDEFKEALGEQKDNWYARAIIHQDIFSSDKGELLLSIDKNGVTQKAVLKDVIFFGDIRAKKI